MKTTTLQFVTTFLLSTALLSSCTRSYYILVNRDNSALVSSTASYEINSLDHLYETPLIHDIDTVEYYVTFKIEDLDSLGAYLPGLTEGFFQFQWNDSTLTITDGHTEPFNSDWWACCHVLMTIQFKQDITVHGSSTGRFKKKKKNVVTIWRPKRQLRLGKKKTNLIIRLESGH